MFLKSVQFTDLPQENTYPFNLAALRGLKTLSLDRPVTFFVGENGSGKSTLLEAIAERAGFNREGGSQSHSFATVPSEASLETYIRLAWLPKVHQGFFLRAESFFNFASYVDDLKREFPTQYDAYGGKSLHQQSHGESFLALFTHRFKNRDKALYLLDEPEAALSPARQLALLRLIWEHEQSGKSQFIIATHSPILLGYPKAQILNFDTAPLTPIHYEDTEHYVITKEFLKNREGMLRELFKPD